MYVTRDESNGSVFVAATHSFALFVSHSYILCVSHSYKYKKKRVEKQPASTCLLNDKLTTGPGVSVNDGEELGFSVSNDVDAEEKLRTQPVFSANVPSGVRSICRSVNVAMPRSATATVVPLSTTPVPLRKSAMATAMCAVPVTPALRNASVNQYVG
jgi:hypothetical protein